MTIQEANSYLAGRLVPVYGEGESVAMTDLLLEKITGKRGAALGARGPEPLPVTAAHQLEEWTSRLLAHEPIQHILGEAWFMDYRFFVDGSVLVPRPETEELVDWIIRDRRYRPDGWRMLDIGTGSGCIAVSLVKKLAGLKADAIDLSSAAIAVARKNADSIGAEVEFREMDFLDKKNIASLPVYDLITSNPPYIPLSDRESMPLNVTGFEPATALFVPDNDPLVFYRAIAEFGQQHLAPGGSIYMEIYEDAGQATLDLFNAAAYECTLRQDMQGKDRMLRAVKPGNKKA